MVVISGDVVWCGTPTDDLSERGVVQGIPASNDRADSGTKSIRRGKHGGLREIERKTLKENLN